MPDTCAAACMSCRIHPARSARRMPNHGGAVAAQMTLHAGIARTSALTAARQVLLDTARCNTRGAAAAVSSWCSSQRLSELTLTCAIALQLLSRSWSPSVGVGEGTSRDAERDRPRARRTAEPAWSPSFAALESCMPMVIGTLRHTSPLNIPVRRPGELWRRHVATRRRSVRLSELPRTYADASGSGQRDEAPLQRIDRYGLGLDLSAKASSDPKRRRKSSATAQETGQAADEEEVMGEELRQFFEATVDDSPSVDASEPGAKSGRRSRASGGSVRKSALEVSLRRWMQEYPDAIILVQVGSFYEVILLLSSPHKLSADYVLADLF